MATAAPSDNALKTNDQAATEELPQPMRPSDDALAEAYADVAAPEFYTQEEVTRNEMQTAFNAAPPLDVTEKVNKHFPRDKERDDQLAIEQYNRFQVSKNIYDTLNQDGKEYKVGGKVVNRMSLVDVYNNYDILRRSSQLTGMQREPTGEEVMAALSVPAIAAAFAPAIGSIYLPSILGSTAIGVATYMILDRLIPIDKMMEEKKKKGEVTNDEAARIEGLTFIGKMIASGAASRVAFSTIEAFTISKIIKNEWGREITLNQDQGAMLWHRGMVELGDGKAYFSEIFPKLNIKFALEIINRGMTIKIPAQKIITLVDSPRWAKIKDIFGMAPSRPVTTVEDLGAWEYKFGSQGSAKATPTKPQPVEPKLLTGPKTTPSSGAVAEPAPYQPMSPKVAAAAGVAAAPGIATPTPPELIDSEQELAQIYSFQDTQIEGLVGTTIGQGEVQGVLLDAGDIFREVSSKRDMNYIAEKLYRISASLDSRFYTAPLKPGDAAAIKTITDLYDSIDLTRYPQLQATRDLIKALATQDPVAAKAALEKVDNILAEPVILPPSGKGFLEQQLAATVEEAKALATELGVGDRIEVEYIEEEGRILDPNDPEDLEIIKLQYSEKEIQNALSKNEQFQIRGRHTPISLQGEPYRGKITFWMGAEKVDVWHEFSHVIQKAGGLPGWAGTAEQQARYLEEKLSTGKAQEIIEFTKAGSKIPSGLSKSTQGESIKLKADQGNTAPESVTDFAVRLLGEGKQVESKQISKAMLAGRPISASEIARWQKQAKEQGVSPQGITNAVATFKQYNKIIENGRFVMITMPEPTTAIMREGVMNTAATQGVRRERMDKVYEGIQAGEKSVEVGKLIKGGRAEVEIPKEIRGLTPEVFLNIPITHVDLQSPVPKGLNVPVCVTGNPHLVNFVKPHPSWDKLIKVVRVKPVYKGSALANKAVIDSIKYAKSVDARILITSFRAKQPWTLARLTDFVPTDPKNSSFLDLWKKPSPGEGGKGVNAVPFVPKGEGVKKLLRANGWKTADELYGEGGKWWWSESRGVDPKILSAIGKDTQFEYCDLLHRGCPACQNCQKLTYPKSFGSPIIGVTDEPYCEHGCPQCFVRLGQSGIKGRQGITIGKNAKQAGTGKIDYAALFPQTVSILQKIVRPSASGVVDYVASYFHKPMAEQMDQVMSLFNNGKVTAKNLITMQGEILNAAKSDVEYSVRRRPSLPKEVTDLPTEDLETLIEQRYAVGASQRELNLLETELAKRVTEDILEMGEEEPNMGEDENQGANVTDALIEQYRRYLEATKTGKSVNGTTAEEYRAGFLGVVEEIATVPLKAGVTNDQAFEAAKDAYEWKRKLLDRRKGVSYSVRRKPVQPFFYKSEQVIKDKIPSAVTGEQLVNTLKAAGVKNEEIDVLGFSALDPKAKILKENVLMMIEANRVPMQETLKAEHARPDLVKAYEKNVFDTSALYDKGMTALYKADIGLIDRTEILRDLSLGTQWKKANKLSYDNALTNAKKADPNFDWESLTKMADQRKAISKKMEADDALRPSYGPDTHRNFNTPGITNYRELLINLNRGNAVREFDHFQERMNTKYGYGFLKHKNITAAEIKKYKDLKEKVYALGTAPKDFKAGHMGELGLNLVAWGMVGDIDIDGEKVFLLDENQSDWHQRGAKEGYAQSYYPSFEAAEKALKKIDKGATFVEQSRYDKEGREKFSFAVKEWHSSGLFKKNGAVVLSLLPNGKYEWSGTRSNVPDAPFKGNWHEVIFKRTLALAAKEGYKIFAWNVGQTIIDRYKLERFMEFIRWFKEEDGTYSLQARSDDGFNLVEIGNSIPAAQLEDYVGAELAKQIIDGEGEPISTFVADPNVPGGRRSDNVEGNTWYNIDAKNFKVGGKFHRMLYDQWLPQFANKYLKKYGVATKSIDYDMGRKTKVYVTMKSDGTFMIQDFISGEVYHKSVTADYLPNWIGKENAKRVMQEKAHHESVVFMNTGKFIPMHSVEITPQMKSDFEIYGQPLYSVRRVPASQVKAIVRKQTGQVKAGDVINESAALKRMLGQEEKLSAEFEKEMQRMIDQEMANEDLIIKGYEKEIEKLNKQIDAGIFAVAEEKGKAQNRLAALKEKYRLAKETTRQRLALRKEISGLVSSISNAPGNVAISAEYQIMIDKLRDKFNLKNVAEKWIKKRESMATFVERMKAEGKPIPIPTEKMKILDMKLLKEMTMADLRDLKDAIDKLVTLGATKLKARKAAYEAEKRKLKDTLIGGVKAFNSKTYPDVPIGKDPNVMYRRYVDLLNWTRKSKLALRPIDGLAEVTGMTMVKDILDADFSKYLDYDVNPDLAFLRTVVPDWVAHVKGMSVGQLNRIGAWLLLRRQGGAVRLQNTGKLEEAQKIVLTPEEQKAADFFSDVMIKLFPHIKEYSMINFNIDVGQEENYVSFHWDSEGMNDLKAYDRFGTRPETEFAQLTKKVNKGFTESVYEKSGIMLELNIDKIFRRHVDDVVYLLTTGRNIQQIYEVVNSPQMREALGDLGALAWLTELDLWARKFGIEGGKRLAAIDFIRRNLGAGVLAFRLSSILMQLSSFTDTIATIGPKYATKGSLALVEREWRDFIWNNFPEVRKAVGDDPAYRDLGAGMLNKLSGKAMMPTIILDGLMRFTAAAGSYIYECERLGVPVDIVNPSKKIIRAATKLMRDSQGSSFQKDVPLALSAGWGLFENRSLNKLFFQFQNFTINQFANAERRFWREGIKVGNWKNASAYMFWVMLVGGALAVQLRRASRKVTKPMSGRNRKEDPFWVDLIQENFSKIPIAGQVSSAITYGSMPVPAIKTSEDMLGGLSSAVKGKEFNTKVRGLLRAAGAAGAIGGVPAASPVSEALQEFFQDKPKSKGRIR